MSTMDIRPVRTRRDRRTFLTFPWADLSLTSDDNPNVPILLDRMGARIYKRYRVYRMPV